MSTLGIIAGREMRVALRNRSILISGLIFAIWLPVMSAMGIAAGAGEEVTTLAGSIAAVTLPVGVFMGYIFCADAFLREKRDGTIETLLCTPVSLRCLWEGKAVGVAVPAYLTTLLSAAVTAAAVTGLTGAPVAAEPLLLAHLAVVVPVWIAAAAGLIGAAQLALGMRENQILGFVLIFGFVFLIIGLQQVVPGGPGISATTEAVLAAAGVALLALARVIAGKVTKERIVRTIP
ncbi:MULTISPECIES: ABC transporter permease subunit [unclassified Methanoculleus]|jgi:ABC-2 type transport system permease protein|uniref:ABC transporter permease subunit n=1 Tax=unclassified Methanoculleus TaxID=2619537 RepID=UPI0025F89A37|nr:MULTISPECIES: ABC transporter permease subunit [unclassified Methanoculleus]MCK9316964.1 ABC transporter permease [Methanoculleus sp.]MDD2252840.1 ABC transporter permease subunit [Methanoculleus sp.]MDD2787195.1 ABC transporter permease subunit [Methanoculleus sp.]MDD3215743.1 ABC transporter permease subunit [Methanoculleus sp.]MDD4313498.1 ABC transporter permease subunit [Methanoculleus sp.]